MADIFVSYARQDRDRVVRLVAALEAQGWSVWWDPDITAGEEFDTLIQRELEAARSLIVVWTPHSVESRWVRGEARDAADRGVLVPVRMDNARLPIDFRAMHVTDLDGWDGDRNHAAFLSLCRAVEAKLGGAALAAPIASPAAALTALPGPAQISICVLPFANMSGDPEQEYFSDGITEDIITELSRWHMLAVRSRAASFRYRGAAIDVRDVAAELAVRFIVEGSVRRMGERVRITAQLIDAEAGTHVWAEKFDRALSDLFAVQDEVVRTIVATLVGRVQARDAASARRKPPSSLMAYECVLKGNALPWAEPEGFAEATRLFEMAIALDPGYGLAHSLLAAMRYTQWYDDPIGADDALHEAYALAMRGVELDPDESTCHSLLAQVHHLRGEFDLCRQRILRSAELNPCNQWNLADMGMMLNYLGEPEHALGWFERALRVDPYFGPSWYWREYGLAYLLLHRHEEAVAMFNHLTDRHYRHLALKAAGHALLGQAEAARHAVAECMAVRPAFSIEHFLAKTPFRRSTDAEYLAAAMRLAGFPEHRPA